MRTCVGFRVKTGLALTRVCASAAVLHSGSVKLRLQAGWIRDGQHQVASRAIVIWRLNYRDVRDRFPSALVPDRRLNDVFVAIDGPRSTSA